MILDLDVLWVWIWIWVGFGLILAWILVGFGSILAWILVGFGSILVPCSVHSSHTSLGGPRKSSFLVKILRKILGSS